MKQMRLKEIVSLRMFCIVLSLVFALVFMSGCTSETHLFRDVDLGMSYEQVVTAESDSDTCYELDDGSIVCLLISYLDLSGAAVYSFTDQVLTSILFVVDAEITTDESYEILVDAMIERYDQPVGVDTGYDQETQEFVTKVQWAFDDGYILIKYVPGENLSLFFIQSE